MDAIPHQLLVLGISLITFFHAPRTNNEASNLPLSELAESHFSLISSELDSLKLIPGKKGYSIYFDNKRTQDIQVAIRYKSYNGDWVTSKMTTLEPGDHRLMGVSEAKEYYYYAISSEKVNSKEWRGKHRFKTNEDKPKRLAFRKQEIWDCYDVSRCNAYAVFR